MSDARQGSERSQDGFRCEPDEDGEMDCNSEEEGRGNNELLADYRH